ncbi:hypothetical protein DNTS_008565 [Danionella cerebrum]|uniref:START domain-containing protein 1 n=1 Tax=Danionella cerebrum TaxID=2873325 RepID=A0A553MYG5_9TELE|nr:hypothetical protein DNTS_008565 [Danionella translucida]
MAAPALLRQLNMLPAVLKLCGGISYAHSRSMAGLQRTALAAFSQEMVNLQKSFPALRPAHREQRTTAAVDLDMFYQKQGEAALNEALQIVQSRDGWQLELAEANGDVIYSKLLKGNRKVFRLEAELNTNTEELYDILFFRVEEMHHWNPSISRIRVLKHAGSNTMVTHEVSAETAGNLIGQRDFLTEDGPTCIILQPLEHHPERSRFIWLLNMDIKGWLPQSVVNKALPRAQADFTKHLRRRLEKQH